MFISRARLTNIFGSLKQWLIKVPVGVIGGYHGGNLGDMALGNSVMLQLGEVNIKSGLQIIYHLERWPVTRLSIVGGGAVGHANILEKMAARYTGKFKSLAFLGVDFVEPHNYPEAVFAMLRQCAYVSCRSKSQSEIMTTLTGRQDIPYHPDIAYSLLSPYCHAQRAVRASSVPSGKKRLLVNVLALYAKVTHGKVESIDRDKMEKSWVYDNFERMHENYKLVVHEIIGNALKDGYEVETIPFTPLDDVYSRILLAGLPVRFTPYSPDPTAMLRKICAAQAIIATRYHATIFALKAGVRTFPIAYATKNESMFEDLGVDHAAFLSSGDLAAGSSKALPALQIESSRINELEKLSTQAIQNCIQALRANQGA
jgi:hypothetical protein